MKENVRQPNRTKRLARCVVLIGFCVLGLSVRNHAAAQSIMKRAQRYEPLLIQAAANHGVDARLLWVIAFLESRFNPAAVSRKGARGMMQLMPATAARYGVRDAHDPGAASEAAARYLRFLLTRYGNRTELALAAYNAGEGTVDAYLTGRTIKAGERIINPKGRVTGGIPPYAETRAYVSRGLRLLNSPLRMAVVVPSTLKSTLPVIDEPQSNDLPKVEDGSQPRSLVRQSLRPFVAETASAQAEEKLSKPVQMPSRRSVYFVDIP